MNATLWITSTHYDMHSSILYMTTICSVWELHIIIKQTPTWVVTTSFIYDKLLPALPKILNEKLALICMLSLISNAALHNLTTLTGWVIFLKSNQLHPLLICNWFLKNQVRKIKFDKLYFQLDFYCLCSLQKSSSK